MIIGNEKGFSLIELLLVVTIIGIVAAIAIPAFQKGLWAAENSRAVANLRTINSTQVAFFTQRSRFGRLPELQTILNGGLGTTVVDRVVRGTYTFEMSPVTPTDAELATQFTITATRAVGTDTVYRYELTQSGKITQILPAVRELDSF